MSKSTRKTRPFSLRFVKLARHHAEDLQAREGCVCVDKRNALSRVLTHTYSVVLQGRHAGKKVCEAKNGDF